jgi:DNA-binding NarL/FixJ family response regulator
MKVVLIDPSALVRGRIIRLVAALPQADVVVASGGGHWLSNLGRLDPDLVILEVRGPGGDSLRPTLAKIRQMRRHGRRPSIGILTNAVSRQHRQSCLDAGADFFLDKSLEFEKVPAILRRWRRSGEHR